MVTVLITGSTDGLGRALALRLADEGNELVLHGRNEAKLAQLAEEIRRQGAPGPTTVVADLASLEQVNALADEVLAIIDRLDVLVSNAGIGFGEPDSRTRQVSADGYELRFAVNYLAGFLLTHRLLPLLRTSAPARVINVASAGQLPIDFDDLMYERDYDGVNAYRRSKLAQIMSAAEFAARVPAEEVTFNSLHPGTYMPTKIVTDYGIDPVDSIGGGVTAVYRLITDRELAGVTGRYFNQLKLSRPNAQAADPGARAELWRRSLQLVGLEEIAE